VGVLLALGAMKNRTVAEVIEEYRHAPEFMFTEKADVNARGMTGDTFLHAAVVLNRSEDVDVLIKSGADINAVGDLGNTPLHEAASRGLRQIVLKLLESGARTNVKNEFGQTPADLAALMGHGELAASLKP